ncbi:MAG: hypothetical protein LBJ92_01595 [Holosporales bacterium]|nr:hypothetical protein [Holosporales bacterium]
MNLWFGSLLTFISLACAPVINASIVASAGNISVGSDSKFIVFSENASVKYKGVSLLAKKITVVLNEAKKPRKITAIGKIVYRNGELTIESDSCECDMKFVVFKGQVVITNKLCKVKANTAKYNMTTKQIDIGAGEKVNLVISDTAYKSKKKAR